MHVILSSVNSFIQIAECTRSLWMTYAIWLWQQCQAIQACNDLHADQEVNIACSEKQKLKHRPYKPLFPMRRIRSGGSPAMK